MRNSLKTTLFFLLFMGQAGLASASIIMNGGFETGNLSNWTVTNPGSVGVFNGIGFSCCEPSEGTFFADFNGGQTAPIGKISQDFATSIGTEYRLEFDFGKAGIASGIAALTIDILGDSALLNESVDDQVGGQPGAYDSYSYKFIADSLNTTLRFSDASNGTNSFDALLDNVSVSRVPEPSIVALFAAGLFGIGFARRRKA